MSAKIKPHGHHIMWKQILLVVLVSTAVAAFSTSYRTPAWMLLIPALVSPFWRIERLPKTLRNGTRFLAWAFVVLAVILGLIFMAYPVLSAETALRLSLLAGYGLTVVSVLFLLGTPVWNPAWTLFPTMLGTFVVAFFNPLPQFFWTLVVTGLALVAYLTLETPLPETPNGFALGRLLRVAVSVLGTLLIAGGIIAMLPWAQGQVERVTFGLVSPQSTHYSSFALQSRLGDLEQIKLSTKVVMRVWTTRPQKLRGRAFTGFDGRSWFARAAGATPLVPASNLSSLDPGIADWLDRTPGILFLMPGTAAEEAGAPGTIRTRIVQSIFNAGLLVSPGLKLAVRAPLDHMRADAHENLSTPLTSPVQIYSVINRREGDVAQAAAPSAQVLQESLALPDDTDPRFRELAARLAAEAVTPGQRVERTVQYVQNACQYSLRVGRFRSRQPVAEFFFEKKQGYCQYFASAAAVLLRLQGVPCRYVTGFNVQEWNRRAGHLVVREADAHAWIEAYVPGRGWILADPTPDAELQAVRETLQTGWFSDAVEWLKAHATELMIVARGGDWTALGRWLWAQARALLRALSWRPLAGAVFAVLVLLASWRVWQSVRGTPRGRAVRSGHPASGEVSAELAALMKRVEETLARRGFHRPASQAPLEHLAAIPVGEIPAALREASREVVQSYYQASFGGRPVELPRLGKLQHALDQAGGRG